MRERREVIEVPPGREGGGAGRAGRSAHGEGCGNAAWVQRGRCDATSVVGCRCARETPACIAAVGFRCVRATPTWSAAVGFRCVHETRDASMERKTFRDASMDRTPQSVCALRGVYGGSTLLYARSHPRVIAEYDTLCESIAGPPAPMMLARRHERHFQCTGREAENGRQQSVYSLKDSV